MQTEDQILRRKRQARQKQKLIKICKIMAGMGLVAGILLGIILTSLVAKIKSNSVEEAFNQQIQEQKDKTKELQSKYKQTSEGMQEWSETADWNLILVNGKAPLSESFKVKLEELEDDYQVDYRIVEAAKQMLADCRAEGLSPMVVSGYRDNAK